MARRDMVVIGTSAGGVDALPRILGQLPADFPASIIIVQHLSPDPDTLLASILDRQSRLPVRWIEQGARPEHAHVYIAPPNVHALMVDDHIALVGGARENHVRPSIDRMFRSAAALHGSRVIGILLTGMLDDGVAGMRALQQAGAFTIVEDPETAEFPELPTRALTSLTPDRVLPVDAIGPVLVQLTREDVVATAPPPPVTVEARLDRDDPRDPARMRPLGPQVPFACPDCHGPMSNLSDGKLHRYRCYLGHVTTAQRLLDTGADHIETALWSAIRALHERAMMLDELAGDALRAGNPQSHKIYATRSNTARTQAETARAFMLDLTTTAGAGPAVTP